MKNWFGVKEKTKPNYKFSAVCNRISQSKLWITTALLEHARSTSLIVLNTWLDEKNVHGWNKTGNANLDELTEIFCKRYLGQRLSIDDFDNATQNKQCITGNPWQALYQDCVINFTNESFHYSKMIKNNQEYICPGPFITEKTLKCLLGATAFVPVGQFQTYQTLTNLGLCFDYGFDTSWDLDSGNITRFESIVNLINWLNQHSIDELVSMTVNSNSFNQNHIISGQFFQNCENVNSQSIEKIYSALT
jgi:hypothetical protein